MARILEAGTTHIGHPDDAGVGSTNKEHRYVTFQDVNGGVHTILVAPDHPITNPRELVQAWEDGTLEAYPTVSAPAPQPQQTVTEGY